jgi:hypothetical protein
MASSINASTSGAGGVITTADATGILQLQAAGTTIATISSTGLALNTGNITLPSGAAPAFAAYANASISMANNTATKILFQTEEFDTNNNFASSTFTPTVAGYYQINAAIAFGGWTSTYLFTMIYKNGSEYKRGSATANNLSGLNGIVSSIVYFNGSTDYVEIYGQHNNGVAQSTSAFGVSAVWFNGSFVRSA